MSIEAIAEQVLTLKHEFDSLEEKFIAARDRMHNALNSQPNGAYSWHGFTFIKIDQTNVISVNKESVVTALHSAGLTSEVIQHVLNNALIERERGPGIRIVPPQA